MKYLIIFLLSFPVFASNYSSVAVYAGDDNGVIFDTGFENARIELDPVNQSVAVKAAFNATQGVKVWSGIGSSFNEQYVTDNSNKWLVKSIEVRDYYSMAFIEVEHKIGVFLRISKLYGENSATFINEYETKTVRFDIDDIKTFVGIKFKF